VDSDLRLQVSRPNCAYCKAAVEIGETKRACEACMSWSHLECVDLHGGCPACGAGLPALSATTRARVAAKGLPGREVDPEPLEPAPDETQAPLPPLELSVPPTKPVDAFLITVFGLACFAVSMVVLGLLIKTVAFTAPGSNAEIVALAILGSLLSTTLFTTYAADRIRERRWNLEQD